MFEFEIPQPLTENIASYRISKENVGSNPIGKKKRILQETIATQEYLLNEHSLTHEQFKTLVTKTLGVEDIKIVEPHERLKYQLNHLFWKNKDTKTLLRKAYPGRLDSQYTKMRSLLPESIIPAYEGDLVSFKATSQEREEKYYFGIREGNKIQFYENEKQN